MINYQLLEVHYRNITPLHVGCGQSVGIVDLPIIRERTTGYPYLPGSGIRGVLRDILEKKDSNKAIGYLGSEKGGEDGQGSAGCISVIDARILFYPVRSAPKVFTWITCPFVLNRYIRDRKSFIEKDTNIFNGNLTEPAEEQFLGSDVNSIYLEEFPFTKPAESDWNFIGKFDGIDESRVILVNDKTFLYFVKNATMVTQHNQLTSAKTVKTGALFSIEALPPETYLYGFVGQRLKLDEPSENNTKIKEFRKDLLGADKTDSHMVIGGHESTGMGLTKMVWIE